MRAKKKPAKKKSKTQAKRRDTRFKPGVIPEGSSPFQKGNKAAVGHGRPPAIGSPRAMLKHYAEKIAPEKLRKEIKAWYPELTKDELHRLSWAETVALALLAKSAGGDVLAITQALKQIDDSGKDRAEIEFTEPIEEAARDFSSRMASLAKRKRKS